MIWSAAQALRHPCPAVPVDWLHRHHHGRLPMLQESPADPVGYRIYGGSVSVAVATDMGHLSGENNTPELARSVTLDRLAQADALKEMVVELADRNGCEGVYRIFR